MILAIEKVSKHYCSSSRVIQAVTDASLQLSAGDFFSLQGRSGSGKSTLLLVAGGLLQPDAGTVTIAGRNLYAMRPEERAAFRAEQIGFVFQQFHLIPYLNVLDNIQAATLGLPIARRSAARERARQLAGQLDLSHRLDHLPEALSTGERQRTALARALLNRPPLLLADEPTGNLDAENAQIVLEQLSTYAREGGAILLVTHDPLAASHAGTRLQVCDGRLEELAPGMMTSERHGTMP